MNGFWRRFRSSMWGDLPFILVGVFIGWNSDVCCAVKGGSMLPTLHPGEYILFAPYTLLISKTLFQRPMIYPGDVVVMKISDTLSVCKRVIKTTRDADEKSAWEREYFSEEGPPPRYFSPTDESQDDAIVSPQGGVEDHERDDMRYYEWLSKGTRAHDWDTCIDRVANPSMWLWVEGDNKAQSFDSRSAGAIPLECLRGKVFAVAYPRPHWVHTAPVEPCITESPK